MEILIHHPSLEEDEDPRAMHLTHASQDTDFAILHFEEVTARETLCPGFEVGPTRRRVTVSVHATPDGGNLLWHQVTEILRGTPGEWTIVDAVARSCYYKGKKLDQREFLSSIAVEWILKGPFFSAPIKPVMEGSFPYPPPTY